MSTPHEFFKYRSLSGDGVSWLERTICHDEIYLGAPDQFNDPFDCSPIFDISYTVSEMEAFAERVISRNRPGIGCDEMRKEIDLFLFGASKLGKKNSEEHMRKMHDTHVKSAIGVYCVADKADNLLMWSHYADSHRGVCIGFDAERFPFDVAQEICYSLNRDPVLPSDDNEAKLRKSILCKSEDWRYEGEWRIVDPFKGIGTIQIHPRAIRTVILGARISDENRKQILSWIRGRTYLPKVFRAEISTTRFAVELRSVELFHDA
jgi:hypothetical protein